jgi:hypothetical protein
VRKVTAEGEAAQTVSKVIALLPYGRPDQEERSPGAI